MKKLRKLKRGDKIAVVSPSFCAPAIFPDVYELGLTRLQNHFGLQVVEFPTTRRLDATVEERAEDLIAAFEDKEIKAVISTIGGDVQVTYVKRLPKEPFIQNPKPFFGYSDNSHFANFLWLCGIPSYYGGSIMTQYAMQSQMDEYTITYLEYALFSGGKKEVCPSSMFNEVGLNWSDNNNLIKKREYHKNTSWIINGKSDAEGITWGGCLESLDEMLRHNSEIPSLEQFKNIVLFTETSEEIPSADYVSRVYRAFGERGILKNVQGILVGRAKAWEFDKPLDITEREEYRSNQYNSIINTVRKYNATIPIILNMDFGHTDPQCILPMGMPIMIESEKNKITVDFG